MPDPQEGESEKEFINRCIPMVLEDGTAEGNDQAVAICASMWKQAKKEIEPEEVLTDTEKTLVYFGGEVKDLGDGRIGGYLIRFSSPDDPDLVGDFFTKDTDFGDAVTSAVYYQHGMDEKIGKSKLGRAILTKDEFGVWAEYQNKLRDDYEIYLSQRTKMKKMGWSSGTAAHLVDFEMVEGKRWLKSWPLGLDASLTPTPAEPRNTAVTRKSILGELKTTDEPETPMMMA